MFSFSQQKKKNNNNLLVNLYLKKYMRPHHKPPHKPHHKPPPPKPDSDSDSDSDSTEPIYPWNNTQINSYYMWAENFVNSSPAIQFFPGSIYNTQTLSSTSSNSYTSALQYVYSGYSFDGLNANSIFFFTGYSNVTSALTAILTYPDSDSNNFNNATMYGLAYEYLNQTQGLTISNSPNSSTALIGPCFGGATVNGGWSPGTSGAIYSIYEAVTTNGASFSYYEVASGTILSGTGTGILQSGFVSNEYIFNSLTFDIESYGSTGTGSVGQDFLNLFTYIKTNSNSVFSTSGIILIVTVGHSCSNFNGTGQSVCSTIYANQPYYPSVSTTPNYVAGLTTYSSNPTYSWDYISPQLYTQNTGTINEYAANSNIYWTGTESFVSYIQQNQNFSGYTNSSGVFINGYGQNLILPSLLLPGLYNSGGTNNGNSPNLYFYQSSANNVNPIIESSISAIPISYTNDTGAVAFFNTIFGSSSTLGGYCSWVNGTLTAMPTSPPTSLSQITNGSYIWLDSNNNYWGMYVSQPGNGSTAGSPFNNPIYIPTGSAYNTLICQVYGAGGGGGGNGTSLDEGTGYGGGGGAGSYCCFSVAASDPINGLIEVYIPGGGGSGASGSVGGGGGINGSSSGDLTITNFQIPTSVWWNSNSLNSVYSMVASAPSGTGGTGYNNNSAFVEAFPGNPFIQQIAPLIFSQFYAVFGVLIPSTATTIPSLLNAIAALYTIEAAADLVLIAETGAASAADDYSKASQLYALSEWFQSYNQTNQGAGGSGTPSFIGKPYGSPTLNNFMPIQSGTTNSSVYSTTLTQTNSGGAVNYYAYASTCNPLNLGFGGNAESAGNPGAVIFTLTNSTPGNSI
jgi:hypothetical protein